nr:uncharacterized protein LOC111504453 [Leptinotarsa decemlineata]
MKSTNMKDTCMICMMKPFLYFSSYTNSYINLGCRHSTKPSKAPFIRDCKRKRYFGYILQMLTLVSVCLEVCKTLYKNEFKTIVALLLFMELVTMLLILRRIIVGNFFWRKSNRELRVMLYVSQYLRMLRVDEHFVELFRFYHHSFYVGIFGGIVTFVCQMAPYYTEDVNSIIYVVCFSRLALVYLVTSFYLRIWIDIAAYTILLKAIFKQVTREVQHRCAENEISYLILNNALGYHHEQTAFLAKMKKLRRMYMTTLSSLRRTKGALYGLLEFISVSNHLQLTWLLFVTIMGFIGIVQFNTDYFVFCARHLMQLYLLGSFARLCDKIQVSIETMASNLFQVNSVKMTGEEIREIELFAKLLGWEQPIKSENDKTAFGIDFLSDLTVDIFVNCMVLTQLYFWFNK